jgi:hypothetical protein
MLAPVAAHIECNQEHSMTTRRHFLRTVSAASAAFAVTGKHLLEGWPKRGTNLTTLVTPQTMQY